MSKIVLFRDRFAVFEKAYKHLQWSLQKTSGYLEIAPSSEEDRESVEACFSRFETVVELLLNQISKSVELYETWITEGTLRDRLLLMEKLWLIQDVEQILWLREVRNKLAHSYIDEQYMQVLLVVHEFSDTISDFYDILHTYISWIQK